MHEFVMKIGYGVWNFFASMDVSALGTALRIMGVGMLGIFLYYSFYYIGMGRMLASQAFIINYLWPIMSILFAAILLKEKLTFRKGIAISLSFVGVMIVTGKELIQFGYRDFLH